MNLGLVTYLRTYVSREVPLSSFPSGIGLAVATGSPLVTFHLKLITLIYGAVNL